MPRGDDELPVPVPLDAIRGPQHAPRGKSAVRSHVVVSVSQRIRLFGDGRSSSGTPQRPFVLRCRVVNCVCSDSQIVS